MWDNYPPGVTGFEPEIAGALRDGVTIVTWCEECGADVEADCSLYTAGPAPEDVTAYDDAGHEIATTYYFEED